MSEPVEARIGEVAEHVQKAARELIAAMRIALDVAEDFVGDPAALQTLVHGALMAAKFAADTVATAASSATDGAPAGSGGAASERVERVRVD